MQLIDSIRFRNSPDLKDLSIEELFEISLVSQHAYALVKNTLLSNPRDMYHFEVSLSSSPSVRAVKMRNFYNRMDDIAEVEWHFCYKRNSKCQELGDVKETRTVRVSSGKPLVFAKPAKNQYALSCDSIQDVFQFVQYLCSLFSVNVSDLTVGQIQIQHLEAIQSIEPLRKSRQIHIKTMTVSHEEMIRILEGFAVAEKMKISCDPGPNFMYDKPICMTNFQNFTGSWVRGPMLLNLRVAHLTVYNLLLTEEDVIEFLKRELTNCMFCGKISTAVFHKRTSGSRGPIYENKIPGTWDTEKITNALSSYEQEDLPNTKRVWTRHRKNFIDIVTCPDKPSYLALLKNGSIIPARPPPRRARVFLPHGVQRFRN